MARPRKPDHLKIVEGDREDRINRNAPIPQAASDVPPVELSDQAREWWDSLAPDMRDKGVLTDWDAVAFAMGCDVMALFFEFRRLLDSEQNLEASKYTDRGSGGGVIKSPYWQMMRDAHAMSMQTFARFGMTPADRTKLSTRSEDGTPTALDELIS